MNQEAELDKSEAATPYKLDEARKRGSVGRSPEVSSAAVFCAALLYLSTQGWQAVHSQFGFDQAVIVQIGRAELNGAVLATLLWTSLGAVLVLLAPLFIALIIAALLGNLVQNRPTFSAKPVQPDWQRINPVRGLKRLFSLRTLYDTARTLLKLGLLLAMIVFALNSLSSQFFRLSTLSASGYVKALLDDLASLGFKMALMLLIIALLDLLYTRREFSKQMRMSRRELRDEVKHREGDPRIRARLRQLRLELLKRSRGLRNTGGADVIVTNPTHIAVALRYRHGEMDAPQMVAKGAGMLATAMRHIAARKGIPVVQNPSLARQLYRQVDFDRAVPPELYPQMARIIVWVVAMRQADAARRQPARQSPMKSPLRRPDEAR